MLKAKLYLIIVVITMILCTFNTKAEWNDSIRYKGEVVFDFAGGKHTPFWLMNNQYGLSSIEKNNGYLRLGTFKDLDRTKKFSWGVGVDLAVGYRMQSVFNIQQLYGEVKYRCLDLMVGSKEIPGFISDPELASGNLLYANNARPIPQVRAGIFDYADFWVCKGWFAVKGYIAFGKFTDNNWIKHWVNPDTKYTLGTLYHSKAIFFRGGNSNKFPLEFELGMEMATEFGGTTYNYPSIGEKLKMPKTLKNWLKAIIPMGGGSDTPDGEQQNVEGNMLGTWNFALSWNPKTDWSVKVYYEHFFEDHSMLTFDFPWKDGLYGIQAKLPKNRWISDIVYEYLYMKDQSGPVFWNHTPEINEQVSGLDNYYNHYIYNGWQHWGMGIGNPLIIAPIYNADHHLFLSSTRMWGHHLGFKGHPLDELGYRILMSYQKSWGTYLHPFEKVKSSFNLLAEVSYAPKKLKGWKLDLSYGFDSGSLIGNSYGIRLKICKSGWFLSSKSKKRYTL